MLRVGVNEAELSLPMSLAALSGNGSFTSYADLFRDKCAVEYSFSEWVLDRAFVISGIATAHEEWEGVNRLSFAAPVPEPQPEP